MAPEQDPQSTPNQPQTPPVVPETPTFQQQPVMGEMPVVGSQPMVPVKKKSSKKPLLIALAAVLLVLGAGGGVFALVYNKPENVVADSFLNAAKSKSSAGKMTLTSKTDGSPTINVTADFKQDETPQSSVVANVTVDDNGQKTSVDGSIVVDKAGTAYVKIDNLKKIADQLLASSAYGSLYGPEFDTLIGAIDGKWISVSTKDLEQLTGETSNDAEGTCVQGKLIEFRNSASQQGEVRAKYDQNQFIIVESVGTDTINGEWSNHYKLKGDEAKAKSFLKSLKDTTVFKNVDNCVSNDLARDLDDAMNEQSTADTESDTKTTTTVEYWASVWSHQPVKALLTVKDNTSTTTLEYLATLGTKPSVTIPKADKSILDLKDELMTLYTDAYMSPYTLTDDYESSLY